MDNKFLINEEEKKRILNLHESATKRHYLVEQPTLDYSQQSQPETGPQQLINTLGAVVKQGLYGDPYVYAKLGNDYYYSKDVDSDNPNWILATRPKAINAIKSKIFNEKLPEDTNIKPPKKETSKVQPVKITTKKPEKKTTTGTDGGKTTTKKPEKKTTTGSAKISPKLKELGFKIDFNYFDKNKGYYVTKCVQKQCSEFTGDMLGTTFGDAWHAAEHLNVKLNVRPSTVNKMTNLFNKINQSGEIPKLDKKTNFDSEAKEIIYELIPNQSSFQNLPIGTVVGLYYPLSSNYDLAFFQGAIGKSRTSKGKLVDVIAYPYFCKNVNDCKDTAWSEDDLGKKNKFVAGNTLKSGKSFAPVTHLGFIGYKDNNGVPYVVHAIDKQVFAYPTNKLGDGMKIVWAEKS